MKNISVFLLFLLFLTGCSQKNAFYHFDITKEEQLANANLKITKILKDNGDTAGIVSALYLNKVYPNVYTDGEYFYISMYLKEDKEDFLVKANGMLPKGTQTLEANNNFSNLISINNDWNRYYLASFKKDTNETINLSFESNQFSSALLKYQKDEQ